MQLAAESPRARWVVLGATWLVAAILILLHTAVVRDYTVLLDSADPRGASTEASTPMRQIVPVAHADAQMWVRLATSAAEKHEARVRFTHSDNAPDGREVHWSSAFMWLVRAAGAVQRTLTGEKPARAMERSLLWFNAPVLLIALVLCSTWAARFGGSAAGVLVAAALLGHSRIYGEFAPTNVDHHGLVAVAVLGLLLGIVFMSRRGAVFSALCGAIGMWISAATVLPAIALVGAGALLAAWWTRPQAEVAGSRFDPRVWQLWGRVGAVASGVCYLIEYAPSHFSLRLEVNHPFWSLAWWGGAEIVAMVGIWLGRGGRPGRHSPNVAVGTTASTRPARRSGPTLRNFTLHLLAVAIAPLAILLGGTSTFLVRDPFVGELRHFVIEGMSLPAIAGRYGIAAWGYDLASALVLVPAGIVLMHRRDDAAFSLGLLTAVTVGFVVMSVAEMRWCLNAAMAELALFIVLLALQPKKRQLILTAAVGALLFGSFVYRVARDRAANERRATTTMDRLQPLYRNLASVIRASQPEGNIVLLSDPNASAGIGYFGGFNTLGTLYWENAPGLRAAARIICARTDEEAAQLIRGRGITHLALISSANFVGEYCQLLYGTADRAEIEKSFALRIAREPPPWLQPIPYQVPSELKLASPTVRLFKIAFEQTELERLHFTAVARAAAGDQAAAEQILNDAIAKAPAAERFALCESTASAFYEFGADAAAARAFRRALEFSDDPLVANTLAWILATSSDANVRDGRAALAMVEPRLRAALDDPTLLSTFAAACAEVGRFSDAVAAAERAVALVQASGDSTVERLLRQRLDAYRANRPWRQ